MLVTALHSPKECRHCRRQADHKVDHRGKYEPKNEEERQPHNRVCQHVGHRPIRPPGGLSDVYLALLDEDGQGKEGGEDEGGDGEDEKGCAVADALGVVARPPEGGAKDECSDQLEGWTGDPRGKRSTAIAEKFEGTKCIPRHQRMHLPESGAANELSDELL